MTSEIEDPDISLPLWGSTIYIRSIYSIEEGEIASLDGIIVSSSLGSTDNCTLASGVCVIVGGTLTWEPQQDPPHCRYKLVGTYDALLTLRYLVIENHELVFQFSSDYYMQSKLLQHCSLTQTYLTTSSHMLALPNIPSNIMLRDYLLNKSSVYRHKRSIRFITDTQGKQSKYDKVPIQMPRLSQSLFSKSSIADIPLFETRPIKNTRLLNEIL